MIDYRIAAKAFIIKDGKLFMMKRRANDPHKPGAWDIPGGRLDFGESPYDGLTREVKEEISSEVDIIMPIDVQHFTRDDGQHITLIMFLCHLRNGDMKLSEEHQEYKWIDINSEVDTIPKFFHKALNNYNTHIKQ